MKIDDIIKSRETGAIVQIVNFSDEAVIVQVLKVPTDRPTFWKVGELKTILRRKGRWETTWQECS